jgi:hypothetical protein
MGGSVVLQARVPAEIAEALPADIETLGLEGTSEAIREGLMLLHRKAELVSLGRSYDAYYGGQPAPVSDVTAALYPDVES